MRPAVPSRSVLRARGITEAQYIAHYENQGGVCAICKGPPSFAPGRKPVYTGEQRALIAQMRIEKKSFSEIAAAVGLPRTTVHRIQYKKTGPQQVYFIDHDHVTNRVRGLLCRPCNTLIGNAKDQTSILESAIEYLRR